MCEAICDVPDGALGHHTLAERFLQRHLNVALGHPARIHLYDQCRKDIARAAQRQPEVGALGLSEPPHLGPLQPQDPFGGLHRPSFIPVAIPPGGLASFVPVAAERLGLLVLQRLLEDACGREPDQGTDSLLSITALTLSMEPRRDCLCLSFTWCPPSSCGGLLLLGVKRLTSTLTLPQKSLSSYRLFTGILRHDPPGCPPPGQRPGGGGG